MKVVVVLAARITSERLPEKILLPIDGKPIVELIINRLKRSTEIDEIVLATTRRTYHCVKDVIARTRVGIHVGSENDVLRRYYEAATRYDADIVVRATGDNPLVAIEPLDMIVREHKARNADLSHYLELPWGAGVEVISYTALERAHFAVKDDFSREHITQYFYRNRDMFTVYEPVADERFRMKGLSVTVDTREEYLRVKEMYESFTRKGQEYSLAGLLAKRRREEKVLKNIFEVPKK